MYRFYTTENYYRFSSFHCHDAVFRLVLLWVAAVPLQLHIKVTVALRLWRARAARFRGKGLATSGMGSLVEI